MTETFYRVALSLAPRIGDSNTKLLLSHFGSAENIFKCSKNELKKTPGIGEITASGVSNKEIFPKAEKIITDCQKWDVEILTSSDKSYPTLLKQTPDYPSIVYKKGKLDLNFSKSLAIVGTRNATKYGAKITHEVLEQIKNLDCTIVSGLAYGIDVIAHKKCIELGIPNVAVMANGIDSVYPSDHKKVAQKIEEIGALLTENPPGSKPDAPKFPARNRIIVGMTQATLVIEAASKGGALISAEIANSYNREILAVPGPIDAPYSVGCNELIRDHKAHIYTNFNDLTSILGWGEYEKKQKFNPEKLNLNPQQTHIFNYLLQQEKSSTIDQISRDTQLSISTLLPILLEMEFSNILRSVPGNEYEIF